MVAQTVDIIPFILPNAGGCTNDDTIVVCRPDGFIEIIPLLCLVVSTGLMEHVAQTVDPHSFYLAERWLMH